MTEPRSPGPVALRRAGDVLVVVTAGWLCVLGAYAERTGAVQAGRDVPPAALGYVLALAAAGLLALRTRRPVAVAAGVVLVSWIYRASGFPGEAPGLALFVSTYAIGAHAGGDGPGPAGPIGLPAPRGLPVVAVMTAAAVLVPLMPPHVAAPDWGVLGPAIGLVTAALLGVSVHQRRAEAGERVRRAAAVAEATAARRLADQRVEIARELHDVLAQTISVITVQSGLALDVIDDRPDQARPALETIRSTSREAVGQLRAAVRLLRTDRDGPADPREPLTLAGLDRLAEQMRASGLAVSLHRAARDDAPPAVQAAAYRIVQEALTNCVRHSTGTRVDVRLTRGADVLTVEVQDDGRPADPARRTVCSGHGLLGIRERAAALGGRAEAGWPASGGFRVRAELPVA